MKIIYNYSHCIEAVDHVITQFPSNFIAYAFFLAASGLVTMTPNGTPADSGAAANQCQNEIYIAVIIGNS